MDNKKEEKFHQKEWFTIVTLIFFAPIGILFMWKNKHWGSKTRKVLSVVFGIYSIFMIIATIPTEEDKAEEKALQDKVEQEREAKDQAKEDEKEEEKKAKRQTKNLKKRLLKKKKKALTKRLMDGKSKERIYLNIMVRLRF